MNLLRMRKFFFLLFFLSCSYRSENYSTIRNSSGEVLGAYPQDIRWLGFQEEPSWKDLLAFSKLEVLELNTKELRSLEGLPDLPRLRYLNITDSQIRDLSPLRRFEKLDSLVLNGVPITDAGMKTFDGWNRLTRLEMKGSKISNLEFIGPGCKLRHLLIKNTKVKDLSPLGNCTSLQELYLQGTEVKDLVPLYSLSGLFHLQLDGTDVSDDEIRNIRKQLPYLKIMPGLRKILSSEKGLD